MQIWKPSLALFIQFSLLMQLVAFTPSVSLAAEESGLVDPLDSDLTDVPEIDLEALRADRKKKASLYPISKRVSRYLDAAAKEVDAGDPEEATRLLNNLYMNRLNPYERALIYRMLAFVAYGDGDARAAIDNFELFLGQEMLSIKEEARVRFNIAQLYASLQNWPKMIEWLSNWLLYVEEPDPLGYYLMGIGYYQLNQFDKAIEATKLAIGSGDDPKESWLRLLASLYSEKGDHAKATPVFEELILRYPKKQYWVQLSLIYGAQVNYRRALSVQQVAYAQGLLTTDKELKRLARSYLYHDLPYPAAAVLEEGLANGSVEPTASSYELLANSWIQAREYKRSRDPLLKAAELSDHGDLYVRLGQVYMQDENWKTASGFFEKAIGKGGLKDPGNAQLLLGIAYYNDNHLQNARKAFKRARKHDKTKAEANRWITHIDTESGDGDESAG